MNMQEYVKSLMETEDGQAIEISMTMTGSYRDAIAGKLLSLLLDEMPDGSTNEDALKVIDTLIFWVTIFGRCK